MGTGTKSCGEGMDVVTGPTKGDTNARDVGGPVGASDLDMEDKGTGLRLCAASRLDKEENVFCQLPMPQLAAMVTCAV